ncbi:hypothetical protein FQZ97_411350 [compost metagenome]
MAAVRAGNAVAIVQVVQDADARGLLTRVQVDEARDVATREVHMQALLEIADGAHLPVHRQQRLLVERQRGGIL